MRPELSEKPRYVETSNEGDGLIRGTGGVWSGDKLRRSNQFPGRV